MTAEFDVALQCLQPTSTLCGVSHVSPLTKWLHRFAWFTAIATLVLICSGGMVTSKGVGLAVPDWPTTFGYNMFLFPVSKWVGGIFFEHTHRLIASTVGFLTIILAVWIVARGRSPLAAQSRIRRARRWSFCRACSAACA